MSKDWFNGNTYASFTEVVGLDRIDGTTFKSTFPSCSPGNSTRAYGGHFYAQAAWAASQVVKKGFVIHSVTGYFILLSFTNKPFIYKVRKIREGGAYCQLQVNAYQDENKGECFTCLCSFKRPEPTQHDQQLYGNLREKYKEALGDKKPENFPECPGVDAPYYREYEREHGVDPFPGLSMRKVDMAAYNSTRSVVDKRQLQWYSVLGDMPSISEQPNLHACAHLYASDRNSLVLVPNVVEVGNDYSAIASLSHTVVFHSEASDLAMTDADGRPRWFCQEFQVDRVSYGRGYVTSRIWREDGVHVASQSQDGLIRMRGSNERLMGDALTNNLNKKGLMTAREIFGIPGMKVKL